MKNKTIAIAVLSILAVGGYFVYKTKFWEKPVPKTKAEAINLIISTGKSANVNNLLSTFEENYLLAWSEAIVKNKDTFSLNNVEYLTLGGKRKL